MWQRFTERARQIMYQAQEQAKLHTVPSTAPDKTPHVDTEHLLLGLTLVRDNMGLRILEALGLSPLKVREEIEADLPAGGDLRGKDLRGKDLRLTPRAERVIDLAYDVARHLKHDYIGGEHLLLGILREGGSAAAAALTKHGVTEDLVKEQLQLLRDSDLRAMAEAKPDEELLTLDEAVQFLGSSKPTLYRLLGQGDLKGLKVGRQWRFRKADLVAYMERSPVAVAAAPSGELDTELAGFKKMTVEAGRDEAIAGMQMRSLTGTAEEKTEALADLVVSYAIALHASDIHLEPIRQEGVTSLLLRYRIDGVLQEVRRLPMSMHESLIARFKSKADMNLTEKRVPQDGRISIRYEDKEFDMRVSVVPSTSGESFVMRIILKSDVLIGLDNLGLAADDLDRVRGLIRQPNGLLIVTGPTGTGKTTTVYSALDEIARTEVKTLTIEDRVEVRMPFVTQVQVNKRTGVTFPAALRSFLRQDPDVIFVGEMPDLETAALAAEASLTGHLILTTLHAGDAPSALTRLLEMGLAPYLIAATVTGVLAQRLCRRICDGCKEAYPVPARELMRYGLEPDDPDQTITLHRGRGCDRCRHKGYRGRTGLFELLVMTDALAALIVQGVPPADLVAAAHAAGMNSLWRDGLRKILDGVTTPDEVLRVCTAL